jgi:hypothetical protein
MKKLRFTLSKIVLFPCFTNMFEIYLRRGSYLTSTCIEIPFIVYIRLEKIFSPKYHKIQDEVYPLFFSRRPEENIRILEHLRGEDNYKTFISDVKEAVAAGKTFWFFGDPKVLKYLNFILKKGGITSICLYERDEEDVPQICEVYSMYSTKVGSDVTKVALPKEVMCTC